MAIFGIFYGIWYSSWYLVYFHVLVYLDQEKSTTEIQAKF
jgi:hypothetical protein